MTDLNWSIVAGMPWEMLTPWPDECTITYYDFHASNEAVKAGAKTSFAFQNCSAQYEALENGLDVKCKLLPGSTWHPPSG